MYIYIDQSGKVEHSQKSTVVAFSNGKSKSIKISSKEKRKLLIQMRKLDYPQKAYVLKIFAGLIYLLIKDEKVEEMVVDREYYGKEGLLKAMLIQLFEYNQKAPPNIHFLLIGKLHPAHTIAISTFRAELNADLIVTAKDLLELFYRN